MKNPDLLESIIARGEREAGPDPPGFTVHPDLKLAELPWFAAHNQERFAYMFPKRKGNSWTP